MAFAVIKIFSLAAAIHKVDTAAGALRIDEKSISIDAFKRKNFLNVVA